MHSLRVLAGTWNVAEQRPETSWPLRAWLRERSAKADIVAVGLQVGGGWRVCVIVL